MSKTLKKQLFNLNKKKKVKKNNHLKNRLSMQDKSYDCDHFTINNIIPKFLFIVSENFLHVILIINMSLQALLTQKKVFTFRMKNYSASNLLLPSPHHLLYHQPLSLSHISNFPPLFLFFLSERIIELWPLIFRIRQI